MALPLTRNITGSPGDPIRSADFNDIQDQIIALYAGRRGPHWRPASLLAGRVVAGGPGVFNANGSYTASLGTDVLNVVLPVAEGERILGLRARIDPAASGLVSINLVRSTDGATAVLGTPGVSAGAAIQTISVSALTPEAVLGTVGVLYQASFAFTVGGGHVVLSCDVQVDHL